MYLENSKWTNEIKDIQRTIGKGTNGQGSHLQAHFISKDFCDEMHKNGKIVAIWLDGNCPEEKYKEGNEFY